MVDCILKLDQRVTGQVSTRRLRVVKYRGSGFERNEFPFIIGRNGIRLVPISRVKLFHDISPEILPTGNERLDELLGGGLLATSITLISGGSGTGKTSLAATIARETCSRGERVLFVQFEESAEAMVTRLLSPGIDLRASLESGLLRITSTMPESAGTEEHLINILEAIEDHEASMLIVDAISATRRISTEAAAYDFLVRLTNACRQRGIACILTYQNRQISEPDQIMGMGISSVIDTVILLHYVEEDDVLHRMLLVLKSRGMAHSNRRHRFSITERGIVLEDADLASGNARGRS